MKRKIALCVVLALVLAAVAGVPAAAAQDGPQPMTTAEGNSTADQRQGSQIDPDLRLVSTSYDGAGTATLVFETDTAKAVTLADAGGFMDGGHINRRTFVLDGEGTHTVEFQVTESEQGYVGVSIATEEVLYAEVIAEPTVSPFSGASGTTGWMGGASIVLISFVAAGVYVRRKEGGEPVRAGR
jgi:hypothetical protein